jgi:hypothetical protein
MAAATSVTSYIVALGPIKVEFVECTMANSADTYASKLAAPKFAFAQTQTATDTVQATTVVTGKSVAVTSTDISASTVLLLIVGH